LLKVCVAHSLVQFPSSHSGHFIINSWPLWALPLGTKENKVTKLGRYIIHDITSLCPEPQFNKFVYGCLGAIISLILPWIIRWLRLEPHPCHLPHTSPIKIFWASKSVSRVLYPDRVGVVTIHLALVLPSESSDQPEDLGRAPETHPRALRLWGS